MEKNLTALVILTAFSKRSQPLDNEFATALLSNLMNENMDNVKFSNILSSLAEMGYIVQGPSVQITSRGIAIAETLGKTSLNRYDVEFVEKNVERFLAGSPESKKSQVEGLLELVNKRTLFTGRRVEKIQSANFVSNSVKLSISIKPVPVRINFFDAPFVKGFRTGSDRFRTLGWVERSIEEQLGEPAIVKTTSSGFAAYASKDILQVSAPGLNFGRTSVDQKQSMADIPDVCRALISKVLARRFRDKGYSKVGGGKRFVDFSNFTTTPSDLGAFRWYKGFDFRIDYISDGTAITWFDPTRKIMLTVLDFIEHLQRKGLNDSEIANELQGKDVRVIPSETKGEIVAVNTSMIEVAKEKVPDTDTTYSQYWYDRHRFKLNKDFQQTVEVKFGDSSYNYPAETVFFDREEMESLSEMPMTFEGTSLAPVDRLRETEQIMTRLLDLPIEDKFFRIQFGGRLLNWSELEAERFCSGLSRLSPPILRFNIDRQMNEISSDPRSIFKYGPYSKDKDATVQVVLVPVAVPQEVIGRFFENLVSSYRRLGFGTLRFSASSVMRYSPSINKLKLPNLLDSIRPPPDKRAIALVILPPNRLELYLPFKEEIFHRASLPAQVILTSTFDRIARGEVGPLRGTILQVYTKLIGKNEAAWILAEPADDKMETMYVGIGFSATPYTEKSANSFAAMCDAKGADIDWKPIGVPFVGRYIDESWFEGFLRFVQDNLRPGVKRIVVFRKGETYENEIASMKKVADETGGRPWEDFNFVSIINEDRRIISVGEVPQNPESGVFASLSKGEALLVCSLQHAMELHQGTAIPVRLVRSIGNSPIEKIVSEYRALTYLNWTAPVSSSKYPLVVNIANRIAQLVKEQCDVKMLEAYLPL